MTAVTECPWCRHARRSADLLRQGDQLALEHVPAWRGKHCPGPSFGSMTAQGGQAEAPDPTDYAAGRVAGWREAVELVQAALARCRAEGVTPGMVSDRRGRLVALGALLDQMIEAAPR